MSSVIGQGIRFMLLDHDDVQVLTIEAKWAAHRATAKLYYDVDLTDEVLREHWGDR